MSERQIWAGLKSRWPSLFDDEETKASFGRLTSAGYDKRIAFKVAAVDCAFRARIKTGHKPPEAYARSVAEIAKINALVEGYAPEVAADRQNAVYEKTLREGLDDPVHPHAIRFK